MLRRIPLLALLSLVACGGQIDPTATEKSPAQSSTSSGSGSSSSSSGSTTPPGSSSSGGPKGPCGGDVPPFAVDFEDSYKDAFTISGPSAFEAEYDDPIQGSISLHVKPSKSSYLTRKLNGVCAVNLTFKIRPDAKFVASNANLARINAGSRRFTLVLAGGLVALSEELFTTDAVGIGGGQPIAALAVGVASEITLDVDLTSEIVYAAVDGKSEKRDVRKTPVPLQSPAAITAVEIGSTPGIESDPHGSYVLDDITIQ